MTPTEKKQSSIRVRFAPSPTGSLHIGSARTALFNWLFAKKNKGTFILRIEDTDYERSMEKYVEDIIESLKWLGLEWDEGPDSGGKDKGMLGPYRQSKRLETYKKFAEEVVKKELAYKCYCTDEELEAKRIEALSKGKAPKYDGTCRKLSTADHKRMEAEGRKFVYRFKMPTDTIHVDDLIRGKVKFDCSLIGDFVIIKSDGTPSYNFAAVIDDHLMEISHVIRGEDHLSNTPRQIMIYRAFGFEPPQFAHLPIILGTDRSKLSKRHGALSVLEYRKEGYLPDAIFNFLALLGWSPKTNNEIMPKDELIDIFSLDGISKSGAVFDVVKLKWMNGQYLRKMPLNGLVKSIKPYLKEAGYGSNELSDEWVAGLVDALHDNLNVLSDIKDHSKIFFDEEINYEDIKEALYHKHTIEILNRFEGKLKGISELSHDSVDKILIDTAKEEGLKKPEVFKTIRGILTGRSGGPELWKVIKLFGREKVLQRIKKAREMRKI